LQLDLQQFRIPASIKSQPVVCDHIRTPLRFCQVTGFKYWHAIQSQLLRSQ
jgi:hypothetical protein